MNLRTTSGTLLVGIGAILVLLLTSWFLLISPVLGKTSETHDATEQASNRNLFMTSQVTSLKHQQQELPTYARTAKELAGLFPPTADQPGFFAAVTEAAQDAGIPADKVTALSPTAPQLLDAAGQPIPTDGSSATGDEADPDAPVVAEIGEQTVEVTAEGSYAQIQQLLSELEKMDRAFLVSALSIESGDAGSGETASPAGTLTIAITGSTYVASPLTYEEPKNAGSASTAG